MSVVFDGEEIRGTSPVYSSVYTVGLAKVQKTMALFTKRSYNYKSTLDQDVALQIEGSIDEAFTNPIPMGAGWTASAGMTAYDLETQTDYQPYLRVKATAAIAPTSGQLDLNIAPEMDESEW